MYLFRAGTFDVNINLNMHSISIFIIKVSSYLRLFENKPYYYYYQL